MEATTPKSPRRLYDLGLDFVLAHLAKLNSPPAGASKQHKGDVKDPHLPDNDGDARYVERVRMLPQDITNDLLHRLLSSSSVATATTAAEVEARSKRLSGDLLALVSPHLTHLRLRMCMRVTDGAFQCLFFPTPEPPSEPHALREVRLDTCWALTDAALHSLAKGCPSLRKLELINSSRFTSNAFDWPHLTSLDELHIQGCADIRDGAFTYLKGHPSTSLRVLSINGGGDDAKPGNSFLAQLATMCPNLEQLGLSRPFDEPEQLPVLQAGQFSRLRALRLGPVFMHYVATAGERFVEALLDCLPHLEALQCWRMYDVSRLTNEDAARHLKVLLTPHTEAQLCLPALQRTAATLQVLDVPWLDRLTEEEAVVIQFLAQGLPALRFLRFPSPKQEHLEKFLAGCSDSEQKLETLQITAMVNPWNLSVERMEEALMRRIPPSLRVLDLKCFYGSPAMAHVYDQLRAKYPHLLAPVPNSWPIYPSLSYFGYQLP